MMEDFSVKDGRFLTISCRHFVIFTEEAESTPRLDNGVLQSSYQ